MRGDTAPCENSHCQSALNRNDLTSQTGAVVDHFIIAPLPSQGTECAKTSQASGLVNGDWQWISCPEFELGRSYPYHGFLKENRTSPRVVAGDQGKVEVAAVYPWYQSCRLLARQLDLYSLMPRTETLEYRREVMRCIVFCHAKPNSPSKHLTMERGLGLRVQREHSPAASAHPRSTQGSVAPV